MHHIASEMSLIYHHEPVGSPEFPLERVEIDVYRGGHLLTQVVAFQDGEQLEMRYLPVQNVLFALGYAEVSIEADSFFSFGRRGQTDATCASPRTVRLCISELPRQQHVTIFEKNNLIGATVIQDGEDPLPPLLRVLKYEIKRLEHLDA